MFNKGIDGEQIMGYGPPSGFVTDEPLTLNIESFKFPGRFLIKQLEDILKQSDKYWVVSVDKKIMESGDLIIWVMYYSKS